VSPKYEIHAIKSDKTIFLLDRQPRRVEYQSFCRSEVTRKTKQLEVEDGNVPQCPVVGDASAYWLGGRRTV